MNRIVTMKYCRAGNKKSRIILQRKIKRLVTPMTLAITGITRYFLKKYFALKKALPVPYVSMGSGPARLKIVGA
jgi:hypothetical protein